MIVDKRIAKGSITDALMEVIEKSEELDQVLIIYRYKDLGQDKEHMGCSSNEELTLCQGNWLVDVYKNWISRASE